MWFQLNIHFYYLFEVDAKKRKDKISRVAFMNKTFNLKYFDSLYVLITFKML